METSLTFFRVAAYLAGGGLFALAVLPRGLISRGFFRFAAALYAGLAAAGLAIRPGTLEALGAAPAALAALEPAAGAPLLALATVLAAVQAALVGRLGTGAGHALLRLAALLALAGIGLDGQALTGERMGIAAALGSALLLGSVFSAMILGHWYLVMPRLSAGPLLRLTWLYAIAVALRIAITLSSVVPLVPTRRFDGFLEGAGLLLWPRVLFGLLVPLLLALMALPTVRNRDTQPATGMLYVACVLVLVGEGLALYLGTLTHVAV